MKNSIIVDLIAFLPTMIWNLPQSLYWGMFEAPAQLWGADKERPLIERVGNLAWGWPLALILAPVVLPILKEVVRCREAEKAERRVSEAQAQA